MAKFSLGDDVEDEGAVAKRRKTQLEGGETSNPPSQGETGGGGLAVTIDADLLDCSVCFYPLRPPLYQCINGHVACTPCWSKLQQKCHICTLPVLTRNIALEKVLESVHVPCIWADLGCDRSLSYAEKQVHEDACEFGPSSCSIPDCPDKVFAGEWLRHFLEEHKISHSEFRYRESFNVIFNQVSSYFALVGPDKDLFLLVNERIDNMGHGLSLYYVDSPHLGRRVFSYKLMVATEASSVQLKGKVGSIKEWKSGEVRGSMLLLPLGFCVSGEMEVLVSIRGAVVSSE